MTPEAVHLVAYDLLEAALDAGTVEAAVEPLRAELEVLPREELVRVAMALAVEGALQLPGKAGRARLAQRIQHARLNAMWAGS
jgi:hypothetical protein